jgi:hypothetical protein
MHVSWRPVLFRSRDEGSRRPWGSPNEAAVLFEYQHDQNYYFP